MEAHLDHDSISDWDGVWTTEQWNRVASDFERLKDRLNEADTDTLQASLEDFTSFNPQPLF
ncbi:MAG: hypothetical protein NUV56_03310 [Candidatus Uhrbacteria bacterium]|nr:hypothetical protein [Candidatus Uhrbacteria bacterium]